MSDAKVFAITGFGGGVSVGIQADTWDEFVNLARQVYGAETGDVFARDVFNTLKQYAPGAQAVSVVAEAGLQPTYVGTQPVSTVGQPLPQPGYPAQPVAQPVAPTPPPTVAYPGNCAHGQRVYVDKPARGKPWRRWECAIPWSKGVQGRCDAINVEA